MIENTDHTLLKGTKITLFAYSHNSLALILVSNL